MNKHLHRIIFNAARGMRMVVQETATSTGKGASKGTSLGAPKATGKTMSAASVALFGLLVALPGQAQIVSGPMVPGPLRPTVLVAPNGVPLVNIQTPSAAGVSRNVYQQFDVMRNGAILNNSRVNVQTQLGGFVQGNAWLARGPARVILNEINSGSPTHLRGYVEVGGQRAEVIIANPAGISVDGGGFINASRATLTTGTPQFNAMGGLDSFLVRGGTVSIDGAGLDAGKTDYAAILARAVQVNAGIWASELKVVAGANQVSADSGQVTPVTGTGAVPTYALDVAALGGMYAQKITLIGTEAGLGVRNAGSIGAGAGGLVVTAQGRLENTGTLEGQRVELSSSGDIDNRGGTIRQTSMAGLMIDSPVLSNTRGGVIGAEPGDAASGASVANAGNAPSSQATSTATGSTGGISPGNSSYGPPAPGVITAAGTIRNDGGRVYAGGPITLKTPQIDNAGGTLNVATMAVAGARFSNAGGTLNVSQSFGANVGQFDNTGGKLNAGSVNITASDDLLNVDGTLTSDGDAHLVVGGRLDNTRGTLAAMGRLTARATKTVDNTAGTVGAGTDLYVKAQALNTTGAMRGGNDTTLAVDGVLVNGGSITAGRHTTIDSGNVASGSAGLLGAGVQNDGKLGAVGDLRVTATGALVANGTNLAAGNATLQGASVDLSGKQTSAANIAVTSTQGDVKTGKATIATPGTLSILANAQAAQTLVNDGGKLNADRLNLKVSNIVNTQLGEIVQTGTAATTVAVSGTLNNDGGRIASNSQDLGLRAAAFGNAAGKTEHAGAGTLRIEGGSYSGAGGEITGNGALVVDMSSSFQQDGGRTNAGQITIDAGSLSNRGGKIAGTSLSVDTRGGALDNGARGTMTATGAVTLRSGALNNDAGLIQSDGALLIDTNRQTLTNTNAADYRSQPQDLAGGIVSAGTLTLKTGALNNTAGAIGSKDALTADTLAFTNTAKGVVLGQATVNVKTNGAGYDNAGGQTLAVSDLGLDAGGGTIGNTGGLIRSTATATLKAGSVVNTNTPSAEQGIEGRNFVVTGSVEVNNTGGRISAVETLSIKDPNAAEPAARTLSIVNTNGVLMGGQLAALGADGKMNSGVGGVFLRAKSFSGDGQVISANDLGIALVQDVTNNGQVSGNGNLTYTTTGKFTSNAKLLAGQTLTVGGSSVDNTAGAEMSGRNTIVNAGATLTNRGLIDSAGATQLNAGTLDNVGTGRIYGNAVSVAASALNNYAETVGGVTKAATIAARETLNIGADTVSNREHALIFSGGTGANAMKIGGRLDGNREATTSGSVLDNLSARIESLGGMTISMEQLNNLDTHIKLGPPTTTKQFSRTIGIEGIGHLKPEDVVYTIGNPDLLIRSPGGNWRPANGHVWGLWDKTIATTTDTAVDADPAAIVAGRSMTLNGAGLNRNSRIVAGDTLAAPGIANEALKGQRATHTGSIVLWRASRREPDIIEPVSIVSVDVGAYEKTGNVNAIQGYDAGNAPQGTSGGNATIVEVQSNVAAVVKAVPRTAGAAMGDGNGASASRTIPMVVRTSSPRNAIPQASLFNLNAGPRGYLIETDPRFANYRQWLSSDYLLANMGVDPNTTLKRLGDGFYEQKLIREQVAQLTGYRYLEGQYNDEAQYTALMNSGATFARQYGLRPGIALTAAQMAQLTSDIVWLVEQTVSLPDGSTRNVLAPQLYVRVRPGDIDGAGALLSADATVIEGGGGDLVNTGTIAGRAMVKIDKDNVHNLGGRIAGGDVRVHAAGDIDNIGGSIVAGDSAVLTAGRDINVRTTTQTQGGAQANRTNIDRVAGVYVSNPKGILAASAGRDVNLVGGILANAGADSETLVKAKRDINVSTVKEAVHQEQGRNTARFLSQSSSREVGSQIVGDGDVTLDARNDIRIRGSSINAQGDLTLKAREGNVRVEAGRATVALDLASASKTKGFLSSKSTAQRDSLREDNAIGSALGGRNVEVSGQNVTVSGSEVIADKNLAIVAKRDLTIEAARNTRSESSYRGTAKSGLMGSGGVGFTIGSRSESTDTRGESTSAAASTVGSIGGSTTLIAGNQYTQTGSDVVAPGGDVSIAAKKVAIVEARESRKTTTENKTGQSGLTIAFSNPVVSTVLQALNTADTAKATATTGSRRMQAMGAAVTALNAYNTANNIAAIAQNPASAASVGVMISIGSSKSERQSTDSADTSRGSTVTAGGNVNIRAEDAGKDSDLLVRGSDIQAGDTAKLHSDGNLRLESAQDRIEQHSTNKSSSASVGVAFTVGAQTGLSFNASASQARGKEDGSDVIQHNTHIKAGKKAEISSGGDTTLAGTVIEAERVKARVQGNLNIQSRQDTSAFEGKQISAGGGVSLCVPPICAGASSVSASASKSNTKSDFASVVEQSGIKAGDGGFDVDVKGHTDLKGGAITSTQKAIDDKLNSFESASLTTSDIQNKADYTGEAMRLSGGYSTAAHDKEGNVRKDANGRTVAPASSSGSAGVGSDKGKAGSTTKAGISGIAGDKEARTGDAQARIKPIFNKDKVRKELDAQMLITQQFGPVTTSAWGKYANSKLVDALQNQDKDAIACWSAGGACRVAGHSVIGGLTGGTAGALGAGTGTALVPFLDQMASTAGLSGPAHSAVVAGLAGVVGGALGSSAGATAAFNEANNNYLTSRDVNYLAGKLSRCGATDAACKDAVRAEAKLISDKNDKDTLTCKDQECVDTHINKFVGGAKTFHALYEADRGGSKNTFGALSDIQTTGGLIAANMSAAYGSFPPWKQANCVPLTDAACGTKFESAAANGDILGGGRPGGKVLQYALERLPNTARAHQYSHSGMVCDGSDAGCTVSATFGALRQFAGPGAPGTGQVTSGSVTDIQMPGNFRLGYVTHLVDHITQSVVNITLPKQHGLDRGWVVRSVSTNPSGQTFVNSYGAGTGANPMDVNVWGANPVWGGNVNMSIRPLSSPSSTVNSILCQRFGSCN